MFFNITQLSIEKNLVSIFILFLLPVLPVYSAELSLVEALEEEVEIEEISITGRRTMSNVNRLIERAENVQFDLFNDLVEDKEFQIMCQKITQTGTFISERDCEPRFMKTARKEDGLASKAGNRITLTGSRYSNAPAVYVVDNRSNRELDQQEAKQFEKLDQLMIELGSENEALGNAILEAHRLRAVLKELTREQFWKNRTRK
jgi:hypothetical protein